MNLEGPLFNPKELSTVTYNFTPSILPAMASFHTSFSVLSLLFSPNSAPRHRRPLLKNDLVIHHLVLVPFRGSVQLWDHPNLRLIQGFLVAKHLIHLSPVIPWDLDTISAENKTLRDLVTRGKDIKTNGLCLCDLKVNYLQSLPPPLHPSLGHIPFQQCVTKAVVLTGVCVFLARGSGWCGGV